MTTFTIILILALLTWQCVRRAEVTPWGFVIGEGRQSPVCLTGYRNKRHEPEGFP